MPDPDPEIRGGGGRAGGVRPLDKGKGAVSKNVFFQFGLKIGRGGAGPSPGSATAKSQPKQQLQHSLDQGSRRKKKTKTAWRRTVEKERKEESRYEVKTTATN